MFQFSKRRIVKPPPMNEYVMFNILIWAVVFVAGALVSLDTDVFSMLSPFMAVGMVLSTMVVHKARGRR